MARVAVMGDTESGSFMYAHGAMFPDAVLADGEWYRLVTCMFVHFGIRHVANNMLILFFRYKFGQSSTIMFC